jgi:hypothetical protein
VPEFTRAAIWESGKFSLSALKAGTESMTSPKWRNLMTRILLIFLKFVVFISYGKWRNLLVISTTRETPVMYFYIKTIFLF